MLRLVTAFQSRMVKNEEGAGMVEYALLVALIGILLIAAIGILTTAIGSVFSDTGDVLDGARPPAAG